MIGFLVRGRVMIKIRLRLGLGLGLRLTFITGAVVAEQMLYTQCYTVFNRG